MNFLLFILILFIFHQISGLGRRIKNLESLTNNAGSPKQTTPIISTESPQSTEDIPLYQAPLAPALPAYIEEPNSIEKFFTWLKEDLLLKIGAFLLLLAFGWLTTYAFLNNWIGPMGRIALGIGAGALILILGYWRIQRFQNQGSIFIVLGSTTILLTVFAAREIYGFFTPFTALALMFGSSAFVALAGVKYRIKWLSLASLILAGIAPLLTNSPTVDNIGLFSYLLVVVLGTLWVVALTGERALALASLLMVGGYSLPYLLPFGIQTDQGTLLLFAYAFSTIFFVVNSLGILHSQGKTIRADIVTALINGMFLLAWITTAVAEEWQSLTISAWMLVFASGAFMLFIKTSRRDAFCTYSAVSVVMLAVATAIELDGAALTIGYTLESALVGAVAYMTTRNVDVAEKTSWLLLGPALLSLTSINSSAWKIGVLHEDFFVLLVLMATFATLGVLFHKNKNPEKPSEMGSLLMVVGSIYAYILIWLSLHATLPNDDTAVMFSLFIYTFIGIGTYLTGSRNGYTGLRQYGGALLAVVVGRLMLVDVWNMELTGRIITFFGVGILLMSTAFLGKKKAVLIVALILLTSSSTALAQGTSQETIQKVTSAFSDLQELPKINIQTPTVIKVPFYHNEGERFDVALFNVTTNSFEPYFTEDVFTLTHEPTTLSARGNSGDPELMGDNNFNTYTEFPLLAEKRGFAEITITSKQAITSSAVSFALDNHVALPSTIEIRAVVNGVNSTVVAEKRLQKTITAFPKTTSNQWTITLGYDQPLRVTDLRLLQDKVSLDDTRAIRFLAQPGSIYKIYSRPDRNVIPPVPEAGNLRDAKDIVTVTPLIATPNPTYTIADIDGDKIPDLRDNCVTIANPEQEDVNLNSRGDTCDDFDNDGVLNFKDNCPNLPNATQLDQDGDNTGNICDGEESRLTERYKWVPWLGIGFAGAVLIILLALMARSNPAGTENQQIPPPTPPIA